MERHGLLALSVPTALILFLTSPPSPAQEKGTSDPAAAKTAVDNSEALAKSISRWSGELRSPDIQIRRQAAQVRAVLCIAAGRGHGSSTGGANRCPDRNCDVDARMLFIGAAG